MEPIKTLQLTGALQLAFFDRTNRYFGDYHRVLVDVQIDCDLPLVEKDDSFWQRARSAFGERLTFTRTLERMAVPTADVERVRDRLIDDFLESTGCYLQHPEYLQSLVAVELKKRRPGRNYGN